MLALAVSGAALGAGSPVIAGLKIPFISHGGGDKLPPAPATPDTPRAVSGPAADYPIVLGEPYKVGDTVFSPANAMNYDAVGYASVGGPGNGISAAHHTLPLPSYVEVTSLVTGRTILVRVERRGPMDSTHAIELSPAAAAQLGAGSDGHAPVRVRRVNPLETERALLRAGMNVPERMATPKPLLAVLQRRLATDPNANHAGASLASSVLVGAARDDDDDTPSAKPAPALAAAPVAKPVKALPVAPMPVKAPVQAPMVAARQPGMPPASGASFATAFASPRFTAVAPAKTPGELARAPAPKAAPVRAMPVKVAPVAVPVSRTLALAQPAAAAKPVAPARAKPAPIALEARVNAAPAPVSGGFVVQYGAFAAKPNAQSLAHAAGAQVVGGSGLWRVRSNAYASRPAAEAALAKAKAAGYTQARIQRGD